MEPAFTDHVSHKRSSIHLKNFKAGDVMTQEEINVLVSFINFIKELKDQDLISYLDVCRDTQL